MKTIKYLISIIILHLLMQSCATHLSERVQSIEISNKVKSKLYIDSVYIGEGTSFNANLTKDNNIKNIKFVAEGYKTKTIPGIQYKSSDWYYLSLFPFGALFFPIVFDEGIKAYKYDDKFIVDNMRQYLNHNDNYKHLYLGDLKFGYNKDNKFITIHIYKYNDFIKGDTSFYTERYNFSENQYNDEEEYTSHINNVLVKTNFADTVNTIFYENRNSLFLNLDIKEVHFANIFYSINRYGTATRYSTYDYDSFGVEKLTPVSIGEVNLSGTFTLKNVYGDTLYQSKIFSKSDQIPMKFKTYPSEGKHIIKDALEHCLLDIIDSLKNKDIFKTDTSKIEFKDKISIERPAKTPKTIADAMKATVTIKHKDGVGSGFFISNDGYIISSYNVISKNRECKVITEDGKEFIAKIIRSNKAIDLALLKIDYTTEFTYEVPDKSNADISDEVIAIGTPNSDQLGQTVSKGIISGIRKHKDKNYIQTDIKLNKGNAGGPVILSNGQLNSVVEYKLQGRGVEGISFSIPAYDIFPSLNLGYK